MNAADLLALLGDETLGEIVIPAGVHVIDRPVRIERPVLIRGTGEPSVLRLVNGAQIVPDANHVTIERLRIESTAPRPAIETPGGPGEGVYALTLAALRIVAPTCIRLTDVTVARLQACEIFPRGGVGLDIDGFGRGKKGHFGYDDNNDAIRVSECRFGGTRTGPETLARLTGSAHAKFLMCDFNFGTIGLEMRAGAVHEPKFVQLIGCGFENHMAEALRIEAGRMLRITDLYASHDSTGDHAVVYVGRDFRGEAFVNGAMVRGGARDGIRILAGDVIQLATFRSANNGRTGPGDGLRVFPGVRRLITSGESFEPYSDGNGTLQRHPYKIEAAEWIRN